MFGNKKLINLTPHPIQIWNGNKCMVTIKPEPVAARCAEYYDFLEFLPSQDIGLENDFKIEIGNLMYGYSELPLPEKGTYYIVSILVAQGYKYRSDLLVPYDLVSNENGKILGCRKLVKII